MLQKGKKPRDLITYCHGNGHERLHGPEMRNWSAVWSEPPCRSCKLSASPTWYKESLILRELPYSGCSTHTQRHLSSADLSMQWSQLLRAGVDLTKGMVTRSLLSWEGRSRTSPARNSATPSPLSQSWQPFQETGLQCGFVNKYLHLPNGKRGIYDLILRDRAYTSSVLTALKISSF